METKPFAKRENHKYLAMSNALNCDDLKLTNIVMHLHKVLSRTTWWYILRVTMRLPVSL